MRSDQRDFEAHCALSRFGLGPRPGDRARIAADPRGAVAAELRVEGVATLTDPELASTSDCARALLEKRAVTGLRNGSKLLPPEQATADMMREAGRLPTDLAGGAVPVRAETPGDAHAAVDRLRDRYPLADETAARFVKARACDIGFCERLVLFWANHFTVSLLPDFYLNYVVGAYEREAIRPHVLGRFSDMLAAVTRHPAMLRFLQNDSSVGPSSVGGRRMKRGLNENHARELLELHTLGSDGGYTQADVVALALAMTGWRTDSRPRSEGFGRFAFFGEMHEPGDRTVMGKIYKAGGEEQAAAAIADIARKPATAAHVARRLVMAFVSDDPPPSLIERLTRVFIDTDGDLMQVSLALAGSDEAWAAPRAKMRSPQEFAFAAARVAGTPPEVKTMTQGLAALGQQFWGAASPKGYPIAGADWISPDAQTNRLDFAVAFARRHAGETNPVELSEDLLGDVMSDETRTAVKRASSKQQALALLLMSPEMQRR